MDKDDVDGTIQTLEYVKTHIKDINENTEVIYTAGSGVQVLADDSYLTIVNSNSSRSFFMWGTDKIDDLINAFKGVKATFGK